MVPKAETWCLLDGRKMKKVVSQPPFTKKCDWGLRLTHVYVGVDECRHDRLKS